MSIETGAPAKDLCCLSVTVVYKGSCFTYVFRILTETPQGLSYFVKRMTIRINGFSEKNPKQRNNLKL